MRRPLMIALAAAALSMAFAPPAGAQFYRGIYVAAPGDIWLVGAGGSLVHGRAGSWVRAPEDSPLPDLNAVTGFGPNDVWMVGSEGTILHWNGTSLSRPNSGTDANLVAIFGCAANDIWVLGQSDDESEPPAVLHYNGSTWSRQRLALAVRLSGIAGTCPGDLVITGISFFDPRPDQRRSVGVVWRLRGESWVASGWDGRRTTDEQLGATGWTGVAAGGGAVIIFGGRTALLSSRGGPWRPLAAFPGAAAMVVTPAGSPVAIHAGGFSRLAGTQWRTIGQLATENAAGRAYGASIQQMAMPSAAGNRDTAAVRRITERMEAISRRIPDGGMPNQQQMTEMMQLSQQLLAANGGSLMPGGMDMQQLQQMAAQGQAVQAEAARNQSVGARNAALSFGESPAVFSGPGNDFYVVGAAAVMHVSGDASKLVFSAMCLNARMQQRSASATAECRADGGTGGQPTPLIVPPPMPRVEGPSIQGPTLPNPQPAIRKPKVRIP